MRLKLEIILCDKLYHTSDESSVSTYLKNKSSGCPSSNHQCLRVRASHMGKIMPLSSYRDIDVSQGSMSVVSIPWKLVDLDLSVGSQHYPIWDYLLSI